MTQSPAMAALDLLGRTDPRNGDAVFSAVIQASSAGLEAEALPLARAGAEANPDSARLWLLLGALARRLDRLAEALPALARAIQFAPHDALLAHTHARATMEAGLPATGLFDRAHMLAPGEEGILLDRATAYVVEGRLDEALAGLENRLRFSPNWLEGHRTAAKLRWLRGERDGFTHSLDMALQAAPANAALWGELLNILTHGDLYAEVLDIIPRARAAAGESPVFDGLEAVALAELGRTAEAEPLFAALMPFAHVTMAVRYVRLLLRSGRPAEASAFADQWAGRDPDNVLTPYQSIAWRLTGDPRWQWLEGDARMVGVYDLADRLPSLDALAERLRGLHMDVNQPLEQSLRGGTQAGDPLFSRIDPEIQALRALIVETVEGHVAQLPPAVAGHPTLLGKRAPIRFAGSWSVRLKDAGFHINHVHPAGWISSAFYVALPEAAMGGEDHAGWLALGEASELGVELPPIRLVEPRPGRLVLFPSTMWHGTRPFAEGERLTVAFDVARPV